MTIERRPAAWTLPMAALPFVVLAVATGLVLIWFGAPSLLLLFAGILVAALLDACTRGLGYIVPAPRSWRFAAVVFLFASAAALIIGWSLARLPNQIRGLLAVMDVQLGILERDLAGFGIELFGPDGHQNFVHLLADPGRLFGHVQFAVTGAYVVLIDTIVVVCLGMFFGASPVAYRNGALLFFTPAARPRIRAVMDEMGRMLRSWLLGQLLRSAVIAVLVTALLKLSGVPGPLLLGVQAGVANFVPYLGPLLAAFPIALVAMPLGLPTLVWVMIIYFVIQTIEGFMLAPLIQKGAVNVAPAWTLFSIVVFGALFGAMGIALAAPLVAVGRIAILRLYVEDWLGDVTVR
jgi:predicted PurR-regulated permease PerM